MDDGGFAGMDDASRRNNAGTVFVIGVVIATLVAVVQSPIIILWIVFIGLLALVAFPGDRSRYDTGEMGAQSGDISQHCNVGGTRGLPSAVDAHKVKPLVTRKPCAVQEPYPTQVSVLSRSAYGLMATIVGCILGWMLLNDIGRNPAGLFSDEAEIGVHAHRLLSQGLNQFRPFLFYPHFGYSHLGALPVYATAPAVALLGLSDISVRLSSVIWSMAAVLMLVAVVRHLRWRYGEIGIVLFAFSPVFIHISRINFGHAPSLLCICVGLYAYARARASRSIRWAILGGLAFGASVYGYSSYYIAAPIILFGLAIGELTVSRLAWRQYVSLGTVALVVLVVWFPVVYQAMTNEAFMARFLEKEQTEAPFFSVERLLVLFDNYAKYYSPRYLFEIGEVGLPGSFISRHSVPGSGLLPWIALPLVVLGVAALFRSKPDSGRVFGIAALAIMALYPLPDLISTSVQNPPYTFAVFPTLIFIPLLAALGIHWASGWFQRRWSFRIVPLGLLLIILFGAAQFYTGPYAAYPLVSADYWGWQYGPRQAIYVFEARAHDHDIYVLDPNYNAPAAFLDFYLADDLDLRAKAFVGGTEHINWQQNGLYAVQADRFNQIMGSDDLLRRYVDVVEVVPYPNGRVAIYVVEISIDQQRPPETPW